MVVALGPGKFYGSSLPRPRIYEDVKYNSFRVDPPLPVTDPFMSWAKEAHWSMGGLSFQRHRLQGRIEGNVEKLRNQMEKSFKEKEKSVSPKKKFVTKSVEKFVTKSVEKFVTKSVEEVGKKKKKRVAEATRSESPAPPPAPVANKRRRRYVGLVDEEEGEGEGEGSLSQVVRKLSDEFERVANKKSNVKGSEMEAVGLRTRGRKVVSEEGVKAVSKGKKRLRKVGEENNGGGSARSSPRLVKGR